jgi:excinuclease ABC subunit C
MNRERLQALTALPVKPGVYLMRDEKGTVLYVGKAASLRHRVRSYFGSQPKLTPKLHKMMARLADFEYIVTDSEQEAFILENNLIKKYRPRYNVRLKDDKTYPYIKISLDEEWPRVYTTRRLEKDGARYFGPFASASSVRQTLNLVKRLFPYRSCHKAITGSDARPCLDYHIHRCAAPCIGAVAHEEYQEIIRQVILFLEGRQEQVVKELRRKMEEAAQALDYERAAILRDQVMAIESVGEEQKVASAAVGDEDVIALARAGDEACAMVFLVRGGKLTGREHFVLVGTQDEEPGQVMASFLKQFYHSVLFVPPTILLQTRPAEMTALKAWLQGKRGGRVSLRVPRRGEKKRFVDMVSENASLMLEQLRVKWLADAGKTAAALEELQKQLHLPHPPHRIECYDISNIQGTSAVGSMVVFEGGRPKPPHYRRFKIKTVGSADDYAMLQEILRRRFKRAAAGEGGSAPWAVLPDLLLIDGGKGQLNAAQEVIRELGAESVPVASIAKEHEEVFIPESSEPLPLHRTSQALYLLQRVRDEAHRFALAYHHKVHRKGTMTSALDAVPGIGPKRKRVLLRRFGSVKAIKEAPLDEIAAVMGMTRTLAAKVKEYL